MTKPIKRPRKSARLNNLLLNAIEKAVDQQERNVNDIIRKSLKLARCAQNSAEFIETMHFTGATIDEDTLTSMIRNEVHFRKIYDVILLGINEMMPSVQLHESLMAIMKELLVSGVLDCFIQVVIKDMQQSVQEDVTAMIKLSMAVPSRQLDGIFLDTFSELMCSRELDCILIGAISEVLQSGILDMIILNSISQLQNEVTVVTGVVSIN